MINALFERPERLGHGAYGTVFTYRKDQAVKIIVPDSWDKLQSLIREIHVYRQLSLLDSDSFVELKRVKYLSEYNKMHIFMERADGNLKNISFKDVSAETIENYAIQMFRGLFEMRKHRIFHRDIKPENILVNLKKSKVLYCDFGLSRQFHDDDVEYGTGYIVTRWYRSPELLKHQKKHDRKANLHYTEKMDIWSIGAILYEIIFDTPLAAAETLDDALLLIDRRVNPLNKKNGVEFSNGKPCVKWDYETLIKNDKVTEKVAKCLLGCLKIDASKRYGCPRVLHALGVLDADIAWGYQESGVESTVQYAPMKPYNSHHYDDEGWKERTNKFAELYKRFPTQKKVIAYAIVIYDNTEPAFSTIRHYCNCVLYSALALGSYYNSERCNKLIKYVCGLYSPFKNKGCVFHTISKFVERVVTKDVSLWEKGDFKSFSTFLRSVLEIPKKESNNKRKKIN
jgi:serine/threonine protein kinase